MIDVEQRTLRAFEQKRFAARARCLQERGHVRRHRPQRIGERERLVPRLRERHRFCSIVLDEDEIVELEQRLELRREAIGIEEILEPDRAPGDLVLVRGADAAAGRADLAVAHRAFAGLIERDVVREHQRAGRGDLEP